MVTRDRLICPFCEAVIVERERPPYEIDTYHEDEVTIRDHVRERHPIRWRLRPRWRRAMRQSIAARA